MNEREPVTYKNATEEYMAAVGAFLDASIPGEKAAATDCLVATHDWIVSHLEEKPTDALPEVPQR